MHVNLFIGQAGIPRNYTLVSETAVVHPTNGYHGALLKNNYTGIYTIYVAGLTNTCPQDWARGIDAGQRLKELRLKAGLTQQQLADKADLTQQQVQRFECGERSLWKASLRTATALTRALGVTVEELMSNVG